MNPRLIRERLPRPAAKWTRSFGLAALVGLIAGSAAATLEWLIEHGSDALVGSFTHLGGAVVFQFEWGVLLLPAMGGLIAAGAVALLAPGSEGHGVDILTRAFHRGMGRMPLRGPLVKGAGSALVISCGGSAGPEGPMGALGAAIGSSLARVFPLTPHERRILLVAGAGAGIGAIFRTPLGGALFATSVLYREPEFEADAMVSAVVASVAGYSTFMFFWGQGDFLLQGVDHLTFAKPAELLPYAILGPLCGAFAIFFYYCLHVVEKVLVPLSRLPMWATAAIGGLGTGALACMLPQVMDGRYLFIQNALDGSLYEMNPAAGRGYWTMLFFAVAIAKSLATSLTVGSGATGGMVGPCVFLGGAIGAFLGQASNWTAHWFGAPNIFSDQIVDSLIVAGMGGVLAAAMRTPLAAIVMVTEMTGAYGLIAPLMLVCISSYVVGRRWGLNEEQARTIADSPAHAADPLIHLLEGWRIKDLMETKWPLRVKRDAGMGELIERIVPGTRPVFAVTGDNGDLVGMISVADIAALRENAPLAHTLIAEDIMSEKFATLSEDEDVYYALDLCRRTEQDAIPVMTKGGKRKWIGMFTRELVAERLRQHFERTQQVIVREHAGLGAIERDLQFQQLLMTLAPTKSGQVQRLFVPMQAVGKSLRSANFRKEFNATVLAVEQRDGALQCPPNLDAPLKTDQRLLVIVHEEAPGDLASAAGESRE